MIEFLLAGLIAGFGAGAWLGSVVEGRAARRSLAQEREWQRWVQSGLLDRIQEPDIERREAVQRPAPSGPLPEWLYDETGMVRVEVEPDE